MTPDVSDVTVISSSGFDGEPQNHSRLNTVKGMRCFQVDFDVLRSDGSSGEVRLQFSTSAHTARPSPDPVALFLPASDSLLFSDGGLGRQTVSVTLIDNGLLEGPRSFFVNITRLELIEPRSDLLQTGLSASPYLTEHTSLILTALLQLIASSEMV